MTDDADQEKPLGLPDGALRLMPYQSIWPELYRQEAARIRQAVAPHADIELHHIGSTAVEGLAAKPILDIALVARLQDEQRVAAILVALGYIDRGERSGRHFIRQDGANARTHNLHLYAPDDDRLRKQIAFRDTLRQNPKARDDYMRLKASLLSGTRRDYAPGKTDFITTLAGR